MKLSITQKLLVVIALPIVTLLLFSANHINDKYKLLNTNTLEFTHLKTMQMTSNLIHELQLERGISTSYLNADKTIYLKKKLIEQTEQTDNAILSYRSSVLTLDKRFLSSSNSKYIENTKNILEELSSFRKTISSKEIDAKKAFHYYTFLNNNLIHIITGFEIHTNSYETNTHVTALNQIIQLEELSGQERALVANILYAKNVSEKDMHHLYTLIGEQKDKYTQIIFLLQNMDLSQSLTNIQSTYKNNLFYKTKLKIIEHAEKKNILNDIFKVIGYGGMIHDLLQYKQTKNKKFYNSFLEKRLTFNKLILDYQQYLDQNSNEYRETTTFQSSFQQITLDKHTQINPHKTLQQYKKLDKIELNLEPRAWFEISTQRINAIADIEDKLFTQVYSYLESNIEDIYNTLILQIITTLLTISVLIGGTLYITKKIKFAINSLENGIDDFFKFLRFETENMEDIYTESNDEIKDMAQNINKNRLLIQEHLEEDKDFINEITQIVTMMRDGDFSERPYFEPNNPNLKELKSVFEELIELIAKKIKEQTEELESLNSSLEDRVYQQTMELEGQIKEITHSRDKAIQAEIAKDEFLANMSHEIRTPLNAILGFVTILKRRIKEEKSLNYLNIIDTSGKSLLTIINDILDFSKIQSGKFAITKHFVEPVEEFSSAVLLFASKAYEKHIVYSVYIDPKMPSSINIDATRVKQVISNLLSNAIKFTPENGAVKVKIVIENKHLIISIQDNGIGISKENQSKVFSPFEQADGSTTRKYGGTGLGLSISSKLVALMNGELKLESEENKGSIFILSIPIDIADETPKELIAKDMMSKYTFAILNNCHECKVQTKLLKKYLQDFGVINIIELEKFSKDKYDILIFVPDDEYNEEIALSHKPSLALLRTASVKLANLEHIQPLYAPFIPRLIVEGINKLGLKNIKQESSTPITVDIEDEQQYSGNILVAEDNKTNQTLIKLILMDYGIRHDIANDGVQAVEMFKKGDYDLVLMDENMPELNGIGAMLQIKEYEKENALSSTPVVALTASVLDTDKEKFLNAGMDGFVGKPIDTKELENIFNIYLEKEEEL